MAKPILPDWLKSGINLAEGGFNERADVVKAADGSDLNEFWREIQQTIAIRNAQKNSIINFLTYKVNGPVSQVDVPDEAEFEEASEYGQPVGIRAGGTRLWRGYDFKFYDLAIRYTWMFIAEAGRDQLQTLNNSALEADTTLIMNKVLKTLFNPANVTGVGVNNEPVTAYKFYNGDAEAPPTYKGQTFSAPHNHFTTTGNATLASTHVDQLALKVEEHGYTIQRGYRLVLWVNKQEAALIQAFKTSTGSKWDFVPNPAYYGGKIWVANDGKYVGGPTGTLPGEIGTYGPFHVVEEEYVPAGYMVAIATGGPDNVQNPIGIREHANPAYRGLKVIPGQRSDYPLLDSFYRRGIGTGVRHRGAGAVMQVTASGTYTVPALYA
jgi:hypothetical protein